MSNTVELVQELHDNFLEFSHEYNVQRAFPDIRDGLKPGQRACLWEMYTRGYLSSKPHVKSAKISGGVIANWWPHGDVAIYETFARMSQNWINNVPEVDWHGANGSQIISGDPASARYTEARLSKVVEEGMFSGLKKRNVPMIKNFSEDAEWPDVLPARYPRLMVNGSQGIGSTISQTWLPHDLNDIMEVITNYVKTGELNFSELYPSFPTGGIIINKSEVHKIYETGKGKVVLRGKTEIKGDKILITELPYQVYVEPFIEDIKEGLKKNELTGISDVLNKSSKKNGILIEVQCEADPEAVLSLLFAKTDLQKNYSANQYALINKTPKLLTLKEYIDHFLDHQFDCLRKELSFDRSKAAERKIIVEGLLKALEDIDNIIEMIKKSESAAAAQRTLCERGFSEVQAKAILGMKLSSLARLESGKLQKEYEDLTAEIEKLTAILDSDDKQKEVVIGRFTDFSAKYCGAGRKTEVTEIVVHKQVKAAAAKPEVIPEDCVVVLTEAGYIKRIPKKDFRVQVRGGKGIKTKNEIIKTTVSTNTVDTFFVFTNLGKIYSVKVDKIPVGSNATKGVNAATLLGLDKGEEIQTATSLYQDSNAEYLVCFTKKGLIKKTKLSEYLTARARQGAMALKLKEGDSLANVTMLNDEDVIIVTKSRNILRVKTSDIAATGKATMGRKAIGLSEGNEVLVGLPVSAKKTHLAIVTAAGLGRKIALNDVTIGTLGNKGMMITPKDSADIVGAAVIDKTDKLFVYGDKASICIESENLVEYKGMVKGNIVIKDCVPLGVIKL